MGESAKEKQIGGDHYKNLKIQPVDFCQINQLNYCESNIIKYVTRHKSKNGAEDLQKAKHYINLLLDIEYNENAKDEK